MPRPRDYNLSWDLGPRISDAVNKSPYNIQDLDWSAEGYSLWCVNGKERQFTGKKDPNFCTSRLETR